MNRERSAPPQKTLPNGIVLPDEWPPRRTAEEMRAGEPMALPYLENPPAVVPIDVGRQLFVDDFIVEETSLARRFYKAQPYDGNPVLRPEKRWETLPAPGRAMAFSGGAFYDPQDKLFKMWYMAGNHGCTACATSEDGIAWTKPALDARPGTNVVLLSGRGDSSTAWLDQETDDPSARFKFFQYHFDTRLPCIHTSPDGIHWTGPIWCGFSRDRSTMFYNPFRKVWVFSLRDYIMMDRGPDMGQTRTRRYWETRDFFDVHWKGYDQPSGDVKPGEPALWTACDRLDWEKTGPETRRDSFYNVDAVGYESLMLGLFSVLHHPKPGQRPKFNDVQLGFSRDGFHWDRPFREAIVTIHEPMDPDTWNLGNVQSVGGGCLVVGDRLFVYYSGRNGSEESFTGLAFMRRDGFASMDASSKEGTLTTRPVKFAGKRLFVNVDCPQGELRVEVLDREGRVIEPFTRGTCVPVAADKTLQRVDWKGASDLSALSGKPVRFRFHLKKGSLYSFWVSPDESGASGGYVAAGGPGFIGPADTVGLAAYRSAEECGANDRSPADR